MYEVTVRDSIMIAHSLNHPDFGPARNMHGATFTVDVTFLSAVLTDMNIVIDIALAHEALKNVLKQLNYQNLDELPPFKGKLTTTEFLAKYIHDEVKTEVASQFSGSIKVTLGESHVAWASYKGE
ncbi:MAG: 6-carboxytetrahydropterin synthase [Saprospiraceae bacterium]|nr:6-carboxytetrahydropterin synthase [Saprospiraceae bacterium]